MPPMLLFFPIFIGVVIKRDYQGDKQGSAMIILGIISGIVGWLLGMFVINYLMQGIVHTAKMVTVYPKFSSLRTRCRTMETCLCLSK